MAMATWFMAIEAADVPAAVEEATPPSGEELFGVDIVKLCTLHAIVMGGAFLDVLARYVDILDPGEDSSHEGPWAYEVPADFVARLAGLGDADLEEATTRWAATDELRMDRWTAPDALDTARLIRSVAQEARATGRPMFYAAFL